MQSHKDDNMTGRLLPEHVDSRGHFSEFESLCRQTSKRVHYRIECFFPLNFLPGYCVCVKENLLNALFVFYFHSFWQEGYLRDPSIFIRDSNSHFENQRFVFST